jgi:peroxiredoxin
MNTLLKKSLPPIFLILLLGFLLLQLNNKQPAPNVTFTTIDSREITMASLKNKVVLVNFWATDCPGCIKEMPELIHTYQEFHPQGLEIIAVAMPHDEITQIRNYSQSQQLPFPVTHDRDAQIVQQFGQVNLTPTAFIYNKQGYLIQRTIGELDFTALKQLLNKELGA